MLMKQQFYNVKRKRFDEVIVRSSELSDAMKQSFILSKVKHIIYVSDHPSSLAKI